MRAAAAAFLGSLLCALASGVGVVPRGESPSAASASNEVAKPTAEQGSPEHLSQIMAEMSTPRALKVMPPMNAHLADFIRRRLGGHEETATFDVVDDEPSKAFLQLQATKSKTSAAAASKRQMDANTAREKLNKMIEGSGRKLDLERARCSELADAHRVTMDAAAEDRSDYSVQSSTARSRVVAAQTGSSEVEEKLARLQESRKLHESKCQNDMASLKAQIQLVSKDVATLEGVVKSSMSNCAGAAASLLVACRREETGAQHAISFLAFRHRRIRQRAAKLGSRTARAALRRAMAEAADSESQLAGRRGRGRLRHHSQRHHAQGSMVVVRHHRHQRGGGHRQQGVLGVAAPQLGDPADTWRRRCVATSKPSCEKLSDKFLLMQTGVDDRIDGMKSDLQKTESMCQETSRNYDAQMRDLQTRLGDLQSELAEATKQQVDAEEQSRLADNQMRDLKNEKLRTQSQCEETLKSIGLELCGLKKIRLELFKIEGGQTPVIQDCEVSSWTPEECTATCDGGTQVLRRSVVVPANKGAACPPLVMTRNCNERPCPVDCHADLWSSWSACSAKCGGGVKERVRSFRNRARHGGVPCGPESESVSCHEEACDEDCELSQWTLWSKNCSKACDGGFVMRQRHVARGPRGQGHCPEAYSAARAQFMQCNTHKCKPKSGDILQCRSKLDVILLLDGSGSLGTEGWEKTKAAAQKLVKAFQMGADNAQIAALVFSGPKSEAYQKCAGSVGNATVDMAADCGISWASHFTTDAASLEGTIGGLAWPKSSTLTAAALAMAEVELRTGRQDVPSIVIVITDGRSMTPRKTTSAAKRLRQRSRLLWVAVGGHVPMTDLSRWASRPVAQNAVLVPNYDTLDMPETINKVLADACPLVE